MSLSVLLFGAALAFVWAGLHPFTTYPLSLVALRRRRALPLAPAADAGQDRERWAICVCAYNEERVIRAKMANMLELRMALGGRLDILVYVDAASDRTAEILREFEDRITLVVSPERRGKTHGMNLLVQRTTAPVVIFTDANVIIDPATLPNLRRYFADPTVGCVCGHLIYQNPQATATAETGSLYWRLEEFIKQAESDTGSAMGADGSLFAIRRRLHTTVPEDIIDDMYVSLSILCDGYRVVRAPDVVAYEQPVVSAGEEFRRKIRIACQAFNVHRLMWPRLKRLNPLNLYKYLSHKFLRWLVIYNLGLGAACFLAGILTLDRPWPALAVAAAGVAATTVGLALNIRPVPQAVDILMAFLGTGIGAWRSLRGQRFQTWTPAASVRSLPGPK